MQLTWRNGLDKAEADETMSLLGDAETGDGVAPVGEHVILRLRAHSDVVHQIEPVQADVAGSEHFVVRDSGGTLAGYAHVDTADAPNGLLVAELAVHPEYRRRGVGKRLIQALLERAELPAELPEDTERLKVWSHGEHPGALRLAEQFGFFRARELWRMGRDLAEADETGKAGASLPEGVSIRPFRPGRDEAEVVRVNHRAFSWHPEQGEMSERDLQVKQREDWFDPNGFLLAVDQQDRLLGFHWTKVHPDSTGEVYVVGVDPDARGSGLGKELTLAGMRHLREIGCPQVMLYVEGDNTAAVALYQRLGFQRWDTDVQFSH